MNENIRTLGLLLLFAAARSAAAENAPPPLTVSDAVARAIARAPQLAAGRAGTGASEASQREADSAFSPELWLSATPGYSSGLPVAVAGRVPSIAAVELRKTLFSPELRSETFAARARQALSAGEEQSATSAAVAAIVTLYARCWRDQALVASARREARVREAMARVADASAGEGQLLRIDRERAELEAARARQKLQAAQSDLDLDLWELRRQTGWPADVPVVLAEDPLARFPESPSDEDRAASERHDPERLALAAQAEALERARDALSPAWSPVVEAQAQYARLSRANGYDEFYKKFKADDWSVGVSIGIPLWSRSRGARQDRMRELAAESSFRRLDREWTLDRELRQARADLERAASARDLALRAESLEREGLDQAKMLAAEGRGEAAGSEKQGLSLAQAEDASARADFELLEARVRLLALRGDLAALFAAPAPVSPAGR